MFHDFVFRQLTKNFEATESEKDEFTPVNENFEIEGQRKNSKLADEILPATDGDT